LGHRYNTYVCKIRSSEHVYIGPKCHFRNLIFPPLGGAGTKYDIFRKGHSLSSMVCWG